jgi:hypothetical protein
MASKATLALKIDEWLRRGLLLMVLLLSRASSPTGCRRVSTYRRVLISEATSIVVEHASVVPPGEWQPAARKAFAEFGAGRLKGATVVVVTPRSGKARATPNAATVSMTFEVRVVDADSAKVIWDGMVDTSTWNGRDFLTKNVQANKYDEAYADQFLDIIITTLRSNGFL